LKASASLAGALDCEAWKGNYSWPNVTRKSHARCAAGLALTRAMASVPIAIRLQFDNGNARWANVKASSNVKSGKGKTVYAEHNPQIAAYMRASVEGFKRGSTIYRKHSETSGGLRLWTHKP